MSKAVNFIDIGANLTDAMYSGIYNGSTKHPNDLINVLKRSWDSGLQKIIITGGSLSESRSALDLAGTDARLFSTVGCHPTRCSEFEANGTDPNTYFDSLKQLIQDGGQKVVAIGECGLDYDSLQFCAKDLQKKYFEKQLSLSKDHNLPVFLHCRNAAEDLQEILQNYAGLRGVVHSFDGSVQEAAKFLSMGYYIGLNGCSLKTAENLATIKSIPQDRILLETDCPWCEIRATHAGYQFIARAHVMPSVKKEKWTCDAVVKGRNEPTNIRHVLDVIAAVREEDPNELGEIIYQNTLNLFFNK
ncbi:uncharacterized protein CBL_04426 [Carabus blaptoides fortunei]